MRRQNHTARVLLLASIGHTINKPIAGEIWHLSIEDLFAQPEVLSLGGSGPFVINLSVSTAPISETSRVDRAAHSAQVYQIKVMEDGRMRYRLRLGPFTHEHEADAALPAVRDEYPGALTATAGPADLQMFESMQRDNDKALPTADAPAPLTLEVPVQATLPPPPRAVPAAPSLAKVPTPPTAPPAKVVTPPAAPPLAKTPTAPAAPPALAASPPAAVAPPAAPLAKVVQPPTVAPRVQPVPMVETTQTVRALTPTELNDRTAAPSFVIQLLLAAEPPDPDAVPNLDIFTEYRLYAVAGHDQGTVKHALRLGFFADEAAAKMVASYLAAFYDNPLVIRVSGAEKARFAERRVEARKDVGATGRHAAIEITGDLVARRRLSAPA